MADEGDLLLGHLARNFGYLTPVELDRLIQEGEDSNCTVESLLIERGYVQPHQLDQLRMIQRRPTGKLVFNRPKTNLECELCQVQVVVEGYSDDGEFYCDDCGALLTPLGESGAPPAPSPAESKPAPPPVDTGPLVTRIPPPPPPPSMPAEPPPPPSMPAERPPPPSMSAEPPPSVAPPRASVPPRPVGDRPTGVAMAPGARMAPIAAPPAAPPRPPAPAVPPAPPAQGWSPLPPDAPPSVAAESPLDDDGLPAGFVFAPEASVDEDGLPVGTVVAPDPGGPVALPGWLDDPEPHAARAPAAPAPGEDPLGAARRLIQAGRVDEGIQQLTRVLVVTPDDDAALLLRAQAFLDQGRHESALRDCDQVLRFQPRHARASELRGLVQYRRGNYPLAAADLGRAIELGQPTVQMLTLRGVSLYKSRKLPPARQDFERAIEASRNVSGLDDEILDLLRRAEEFIRSGSFDETGIGSERPADQAHETRAIAYIERHDLFQAAREYQEAGVLERARELYRQVLDQAPSGSLLESAGEKQIDAEVYRDLVCNEQLARVEEKGGQPAAAAACLDAAAAAVRAAGLEPLRGADSALRASRQWTAAGDLAAADASYSTAAELMGWPDLAPVVWLEESLREGRQAALRIDLHNRGAGPARGVWLQAGEHLQLKRDVRFEVIEPGQTISTNVEIVPGRRGQGLRTMLKLFFRVPEPERQLVREFPVQIDVRPSYSPPERLHQRLIGAPPDSTTTPAEDASDGACSCGEPLLDRRWYYCPMCGVPSRSCATCGLGMEPDWTCCPACTT